MKGAYYLKVSFLGQPFEDYGWGADWLAERVNRSGGSLQIAVAWAKRSGLSRLREDVLDFRRRGGDASIIIGIDEGGATKQGLELALTIFDEVYVFHDRSSRTFHPKVYLLRAEGNACLIVGSNNMTLGGLYNNYEATLICDLDLTIDEDRELHQQVSDWFGILRSDQVCKSLDAELLDVLKSNPDYRVGDEDNPRREAPQEKGDYDGVIPDGMDSGVFGASSSRKKGFAPPLETKSPPKGQGRSADSPETPNVGKAKLHWHKRMSSSDAQRPSSSGSNPIGHLKLAQARQGIDQITFFRRKMFGSANWSDIEKPRGVLEVAVVPIDVVVEGVDRGTFDFTIDHAEYRIADQNNTPTWLHWGEFGKVLRESDYTHAWIILERLEDGSHTLEITREDPRETS